MATSAVSRWWRGVGRPATGIRTQGQSFPGDPGLRNGTRVRAQPLAAVYRDLLDKLPSPSRFLVLAHESVAAAVGGWRDDIEAVPAPGHVDFSVWADDGYAALPTATRRIWWSRSRSRGTAKAWSPT